MSKTKLFFEIRDFLNIIALRGHNHEILELLRCNIDCSIFFEMFRYVWIFTIGKVYVTIGKIYFTIGKIYFEIGKTYFTIGKIYFTIGRIYFTIGKI